MPRKPNPQPKPAVSPGKCFYVRNFRPDERADIETEVIGDLTDEINLLRVLLRRFIAATEDDRDFRSVIHNTKIVTRTVAHIGHLYRVRQTLALNHPDPQPLLDQAVAEALKEFREQHPRRPLSK